MKQFLKPILAVVVFLFFQMVGGGVMLAIQGFKNPDSLTTGGMTINPTQLGITLIVTGLLTALTCWFTLKMIRMRQTFDASHINWSMACIAFLAAIAGIFATDLISEQLNLPNLMEEQFLNLAHNFWGILGVAVVGPVVEELVFRAGILGHMLRKGMEPWTAMIVSAILFGAIHMNPAQIPFAAIMGLLLAIIYYKTGNIVITSLIHIFNNSLAVVEMNLLGEEAKTFSYTEGMGGKFVAGVAIIVGIALCIILLQKFWKNVQEPVYVPVPADLPESDEETFQEV